MILVTGSSGLIGSEVSSYFLEQGLKVYGLDNNTRADFFGPSGDTRFNQKRLVETYQKFEHIELDIRDRHKILYLFRDIRPSLIVHTAAQPSHDLAAKRAFDDFDVNAVGTLNLLEATRQYCPRSVFVHMSTNKVYGDRPNTLALEEKSTRWDYADPEWFNGIPEHFPVDQCKHSLFGASKLAADVMVQEYGRYFGIKTCCLRGGCLTGPNHAGVELHGFLSYLVKCNLDKKTYKIYGYGGKQVRDNIHSKDVARFIEAFWQNPKVGEVYNIGGGRENSISIIEAFGAVEKITGIPMIWEYDAKNREGDHICYISNLGKIKNQFPGWDITVGIIETIIQIVDAWKNRISN